MSYPEPRRTISFRWKLAFFFLAGSQVALFFIVAAWVYGFWPAV